MEGPCQYHVILKFDSDLLSDQGLEEGVENLSEEQWSELLAMNAFHKHISKGELVPGDNGFPNPSFAH